MNAKELAEKILNISLSIAWDEPKRLAEIESLLSSALDEARKCCLADDSVCDHKPRAILEAKAEAYANAANEADLLPGNNGSYLANKLRQKAKEVGRV